MKSFCLTLLTLLPPVKRFASIVRVHGSLFVLLSALALPATANEFDALIADALAAEQTHDTARALELFLAADAARPNDAFILQKISRQYSDSTIDTPDLDEKRRRIEKALAYARRSLELEPDNAVYALSVAICHGKLGLYSNARGRVESARQVKTYAERALALDPRYDWACHVLGRWHHEVASLGATQRWLVKLIFGGLPDASPATAVELLRRAVELAPDNPSHHIELGFAYLAANQSELARTAWATGINLPSLEKHDDQAKQRARKALGEPGSTAS
ncbi:MAG: hypothetical protein BroJett029_41460 [Alphaproteobacteria bacterium]|nr:MAG: hypothetical protein BroJett029_41460 [Alphaproteobacteria bacterium]